MKVVFVIEFICLPCVYRGVWGGVRVNWERGGTWFCE